jgi:CHAT domain-containing protein/tetratricopeptide (TPR) repeat protein
VALPPRTLTVAVGSRPPDDGQDVVLERAAEALRLASVDPALAERLGRAVESDSELRENWAAVSVARRARGLAAVQQGRYDGAIALLRAAISAALRAGEDVLVGESNMSLAGALALRGLPSESAAAIDVAISRLSGAAAARARVQRAAIAQDMGRVDEALQDIRTALPVLRRAQDTLWEARALSNRSLLLSTRRLFEAAEADLQRARELCESGDLLLQGAYVEQNLGSVAADRGDVPLALEHFDAAEARYSRLGLEVGSLSVDRAKVLLSVRLIAEARAAADAAASTFTAQRREVSLPEAQLMLSTVALLQNDLPTALSAAKRAVRACSRQGRHEWTTLARYAVLQAEVVAADQDVALRAGLTRRLSRVAAELEEAGWVVPALGARVLAGRNALAEGRRDAARSQLGLAARARRSGPADARSRAWYAEALLREAEGDRRSAKSALRAGLRVVEDYRATLGATELRAHVSVHRGVIAQMGLRLALQDRDARSALWWAEHGRASDMLTRPVRPPQDEVLAGHLHDLRMTMSELEEARGSGSTGAALVARQVRLEETIRARSRHHAASVDGPQARHPTVVELAERLGETALVDYVEQEGQLHAVTVVDGRVRLHPLGPTDSIRHWVSHLPFALHRLASTATRPSQLDAAGQVLTRGAGALQEVLLDPLRRELGDRSLAVVPTGWLQSVPWSVLPACAGRPVTVAPSAALWFAASRRQARPDGGVVAVAGPRLPGAVTEADAVGALYPSSTVLTGEHATAARVAAAFEGARMAHVAAHGTIRADNALFSSLSLADGPYTAYDLERLAATPHHVVLAACNSALAHVTAGEEVLGLSATLLTQETAVLVAPVVTVPDVETVALMTSYHQLLVRGSTPAAALAEAQQQHSANGVRATACSAGFVCLGAGDVPPDVAAPGPPVQATAG